MALLADRARHHGWSARRGNQADATHLTSLPATNAKRLCKGAPRRSNPLFVVRQDGLLRFARNDGQRFRKLANNASANSASTPKRKPSTNVPNPRRRGFGSATG